MYQWSSFFTEPIEGIVSCGAGSKITLYADGLDVATGFDIMEGSYPQDADVLGIECTWPDTVCI